jgi:microcystin-dependent protein
MSDPFVAEIRMVGFNFAPRGWATCDGQILPISQNTALFSLLGTTYGGNGSTTFALPNLQGRSPLQPGQGPGLSLYDLGETTGQSDVTLLQSEIPQHNHTFGALNAVGDTNNPSGSVPARVLGETPYVNAAPNTALAQSLVQAGSSLPHNNLMPYLVVYFCIALQGIFPPRS